MTRLYLRMQGDRKPQSVSEMIEEADKTTEFYRALGIVDGTPGSIGPEDIRSTMNEILEKDGLTGGERYDLLDALYFKGLNNMEFFRISDVEAEIRLAQGRVLHQE